MYQLVTAAALLMAGCADFPPRDDFGAADAGGTTDVSEGEGEVPIAGEGEGEDAGNPPVGEGEGEGEGPVGEGEGEGPTGEGEGEGPVGEGEGEGGEGEGPPVGEGEGEGEGPVGEGEGPPAGEGEGEGGEGEGPIAGEGEGEGPVGEGEGEGPVGEGEGEGPIPCNDADCRHLTDACNTGVCDPLAVNGDDPCMAEPVPDEDLVICDDNLFCTDIGICQQGVCVVADRDCSDLNAVCASGVCDENAQACVADNEVRNGNVCPVQGQCVRGECRNGDCFVLGADVGTPCEDGNRCTEADRCRNDSECRGTPASCAHLNTECATGECNPGTGECRAVPEPDNTPCDDLHFCTVNDRCGGGQCVGANRNCSALNDTCVLGMCDEEADECVADAAVENGSACDDDNRCTGNGACLDGACQPGATLDCSGLTDQCNAGVCDPDAPAGDPCVAQAVENGTPCTDLDDACTLGDSCQGGACVPGPAPDADLDDHVTDACGGDDCDDADPAIKPGAAEACDGVDNNCDGATDLFYDAAPAWTGWSDGGYNATWSLFGDQGCRAAARNNSHLLSPGVNYVACPLRVCVELGDLGGIHVDIRADQNPASGVFHTWEINGDEGGRTCHNLPGGLPNPLYVDLVTRGDEQRTICAFEVYGVFN